LTPVSRPPGSVARHRDASGFALVAAVLAIVLIGAMVSAVVFATTEDTKLAAARIAREVGMMTAESAVAATLLAGPTVIPDSIGVSHTASARITGPGNQVVVYVTRLDSTMFWVVAEVGADANGPVARRRIGILARTERRADGLVGIAPISQRPWSDLF
jgi:type II secretory pathway pseudopilin PulG